ncbi:MAG: GntR family transcriptional regulator [Ilumatobacter fluminis]|uniref:GntR family transcriptional regulator n=1 Tax=Ilumatobacter fluminis TaxID=467091 RepID=UPI0032EE618C
MNVDDLRIRLLDAESTPLYVQISQQIKHLIMTQQLDDGAQLPAVRRLAEHLEINTGTVVQAYHELASEQLVETIRGRGTVVRHLSESSADEMARARLLDEAAAQFALRARALGFEPAEVGARVNRTMLGLRTPVPIVFLARSDRQAFRYAAELDERYDDSSVVFVPIGYEAFAKGEPAALAPFDVAYTVVTFVTMAPEVERLLADRGLQCEIIGVTAQLVTESIDRLESMSADRHYTLVTEGRAVPAALAEIASGSGIDSSTIDVIASTPDHVVDLDEVRAAADAGSVLIYTFGVKEQIDELGLDDDRLIELRFALTGGALERLDQRWEGR